MSDKDQTRDIIDAWKSADLCPVHGTEELGFRCEERPPTDNAGLPDHCEKCGEPHGGEVCPHQTGNAAVEAAMGRAQAHTPNHATDQRVCYLCDARLLAEALVDAQIDRARLEVRAEEAERQLEEARRLHADTSEGFRTTTQSLAETEAELEGVEQERDRAVEAARLALEFITHEGPDRYCDPVPALHAVVEGSEK